MKIPSPAFPPPSVSPTATAAPRSAAAAAPSAAAALTYGFITRKSNNGGAFGVLPVRDGARIGIERGNMGGFALAASSGASNRRKIPLPVTAKQAKRGKATAWLSSASRRRFSRKMSAAVFPEHSDYLAWTPTAGMPVLSPRVWSAMVREVIEVVERYYLGYQLTEHLDLLNSSSVGLPGFVPLTRRIVTGCGGVAAWKERRKAGYSLTIRVNENHNPEGRKMGRRKAFWRHSHLLIVFPAAWRFQGGFFRRYQLLADLPSVVVAAWLGACIRRGIPVSDLAQNAEWVGSRAGFMNYLIKMNSIHAAKYGGGDGQRGALCGGGRGWQFSRNWEFRDPDIRPLSQRQFVFARRLAVRMQLQAAEKNVERAAARKDQGAGKALRSAHASLRHMRKARAGRIRRREYDERGGQWERAAWYSVQSQRRGYSVWLSGAMGAAIYAAVVACCPE